jgi:hypothetical protein
VRGRGHYKLRSLGFALFPDIPQLPSHYSQFVQPQWVAVVLAEVHGLSFSSISLLPGFIVWPILIAGFSVAQHVCEMQGAVWDLSRVRIKALACPRCFLRYVLTVGARCLGWIRMSPRATSGITCAFCYQGAAEGSLGFGLSEIGVRQGAECAGWATVGEPPFPSASVVGNGTFFFISAPISNSPETAANYYCRRVRRFLTSNNRLVHQYSAHTDLPLIYRADSGHYWLPHHNID